MSGILETLTDIINHIEDYWANIIGIFDDVQFSDLYSWLPADIQAACTAMIACIIFIAFIGLLKKIILFLG